MNKPYLTTLLEEVATHTSLEDMAKQESIKLPLQPKETKLKQRDFTKFLYKDKYVRTTTNN